MRRALELATRGWGRVSPNPLVGCVLVRDGRVVGEGWHEGPGTEHAEAMALRLAGDSARGATAFVTLEPCDHHGRTPPCARALIAAGIEGVIAAVATRIPSSTELDRRALREAGSPSRRACSPAEAVRQNLAFIAHVRSGRPFVVLKMASSLDGKAAARDGSSTWISGEEARADVQRLRAWSDAIVVGSGTAVADDPRLTVRDPRTRRRVPGARHRRPSGRVTGEGAPSMRPRRRWWPRPSSHRPRGAGMARRRCRRRCAGPRRERRVAPGADGDARQAGRPGCADGGRPHARLERDPRRRRGSDRPVPRAHVDRRPRRAGVAGRGGRAHARGGVAARHRVRGTPRSRT